MDFTLWSWILAEIVQEIKLFRVGPNTPSSFAAIFLTAPVIALLALSTFPLTSRILDTL